ncbi:mannose-6-phosphate isomerase, type 1 [Agrococcus baldri]|uniref:mannose-6-phosphate isomerase n=2 Tax=Agrococcus baldri TaxID=153730 RepID=A0AA94HKM5_9MICO|nr:mannose-6-phosphate isomerase, type 1 [Agrococcus baldri]
MFALVPAQQPYAWGSTRAIQEYAGVGVPGHPLAEIWFGSHPAGSSTLADGRTLAALIAEDPTRALGAAVAERFDSELPYLVKLLAPGRAVSLQVHPSAARAAQGFAADAAAPASDRRFVDGNHKPEMIFALTQFEGLVGLRSAEDIARTLAPFGLARTQAALEALDPGDEPALRKAVEILATAPAESVAEAVAAATRLAADGSESAGTLLELEQQYPGDAGALVSLMLERVRLAPGESVMVHSGVPHAYLSGLALEVMANSDNVFRLGLTPKRVDVGESIANLITRPAYLSRPHSASASAGVEEFRVDLHEGEGGDKGSQVPAFGPKILIALADQCELVSGDERLELHRGAGAFILDGETPIVHGSGSFAVISVPTS